MSCAAGGDSLLAIASSGLERPSRRALVGRRELTKRWVGAMSSKETCSSIASTRLSDDRAFRATHESTLQSPTCPVDERPGTTRIHYAAWTSPWQERAPSMKDLGRRESRSRLAFRPSPRAFGFASSIWSGESRALRESAKTFPFSVSTFPFDEAFSPTSICSLVQGSDRCVLVGHARFGSWEVLNVYDKHRALTCRLKVYC